ncbi:PREDICTED: basement membrane-specific heparan sulfate proteoglycan core protein, partial [Gavialis gangeticus]|uniref:basement membrane-specific heparan sulfate proteoglycan core protein n=1 Tax=Gavialis gangeticus TaxID=94835 RepID=UPI00092FB8F3
QPAPALQGYRTSAASTRCRGTDWCRKGRPHCGLREGFPCPDVLGSWRPSCPLDAALTWVARRKVDTLRTSLRQVAHTARTLDDASFPEDTESDHAGRRRWSYTDLSDDEDLLADEASGDGNGSGENGSGTPLPGVLPHATAQPEVMVFPTVYYRALVNFTRSIDYSPALDDANSSTFREVSEAVVDTLESEYYKISGEQVVSVVFIKEMDGYIFVELDVGSEGNMDDEEIRQVLYSVIQAGSIASYVTSTEGFQFRRLGAVMPPAVRACTSEEFTCRSGECVDRDFLCDRRPDCRDMSDEEDCEWEPVTLPLPITTMARPVTTRMPATTATPTTPTVTTRRPLTPFPGPFRPTDPSGQHPLEQRPCRRDEAVCANKQCIPHDYLCDGEEDCADGSDERRCGTPSPCEPNEFKCRNGYCALQLWLCDGDNDCGDGSDEMGCPTKAPGDTCGPNQFTCVSNRTCIPASYHCDEEVDCPDRSDEFGCTPPQVITPPEESIQAFPGQTVRFTCVAIGVPTPIITWRLNWGHIPAGRRVSISSEKGRGTLIIRDVKEADQGAYTCEAINARGMVFGIPDGVLSLTPQRGPCSEGHFHIEGTSKCLPCFCFGITKACRSTGRHRHQIRLRFDRPEDFKGVNVTTPALPGMLPLSSTQLQIDPALQEFQLVDLSRRFLVHESFWALPAQFLGNKVDSYGGFLTFKVRYGVARGQPEPVQKPDVIIVGNGQKLIYRARVPTQPSAINQRRVQFTEENWVHESGAPVSREELLVVLQRLESVLLQTVYDNRMASVGLSDIVMDTTTTEVTSLGPARGVEECRCPTGYLGLSCERCDAQFKRVAEGPYLGTCSGCNCHGHSSSCDQVFGYCLSCQHNTEGPQCNKCKPGFFGDATRGTSTACRPCPCPYTEPGRRFSDSCFLDTDGQATCDACAPGYTGRRCEKCAPGYEGNPIQPGGKCTRVGQEIVKCDERGSSDSSGGTCLCKPNVRGRLCNECAAGAFHLSNANPDGCLKCFCMGVSRQCASSSWSRDQVRAVYEDSERAPLSLSNLATTRTVSEGLRFSGPSELAFSDFHALPHDVYYWVLPERFKGDKVTSYGGELRYTVTHSVFPGSQPLPRQPDVLLQGNGIFLEHFAEASPAPGTPTTITVPFRERAWQRADGQDATREHLLMALADINVFMIRASYTDRPSDSRISNIHMDVAVPHSTGLEQALEVEECTCPTGYRGPSCQDCDVGYTRTTSGLYLGTCEPCDCSGHSSDCDTETGDCQSCQHNTEGPRCERCQPGYYGDARRGTPRDCQPCPCHGPYSASQATKVCFLDTDGQPTCTTCAAGYVGRQCERCAPGYVGDPSREQPCREPDDRNGDCHCDPRGSMSGQCDARGQCRCKPNAEGPSCSSCRAGHFHLSAESHEGCLPCFCMGVTQQCASSSSYRDLVSTPFAPGNFQGFALVNRQHSARISTGFTVEASGEGARLSYGRFGEMGQEAYYWHLPEIYQGDKVGSYGGRLRYTLSYSSGGRGTPLPDADVQITGNDITLVAYQPDLAPQDQKSFEIVFREQYWKRPDGQPATREHLMMVLADLDEILIRATYSTDMVSASLSGVSMETAVPTYTALPRAPEVEECRCPPGYQGLSCQDCAPGYTRTGAGLYLGHCELCECNGHSDSCHPETGACSSCLHSTAGEFCDQCAPGFYGDATAGTPEDCQPCACPLPDPENQFSRTCESLGAGGYRCTACEPGYTGQYCEQCAPGYVGNPNVRGQKCLPVARAPLVVRVHPTKTTVAQGSEVILRCQASGNPPYNYHWSREDGQPLPSSTQSRRQGEELHFPSIQPSEAGVYLCTCRNSQHSNTSRAEVVVTEAPSKPITVTVEEKRVQRVKPGADVTFICTAKSKSPAYTLVWTRQNNGKLPSRAMDFNGILTIRNVQPEDAGIYVCTGSNMLDMDEGTATLYVQAPSKTQMFFGPVEVVEGHRPSTHASAPTATIEPAQLTVQPGQPAEFRCVATGSPPPTLEWIGGQNGVLSPRAVVRGGVLRFLAVEPSDESHYLCRVRNSAGQHVARAILQVHSASVPQVQVSPERTEVQEGSTVRLYCRAAGSPTATISWEKQGGSLPPRSRSERTDIATLVIPSITVADGGVYLCVGTSAAGVARARIEVVVRASAAVPPLRIEASASPSSVVVGQTLDLDCVVAGHSQGTVLWYKRGGALPARHQVFGSRLHIPQISAADSGEYVCRVSNGAGPKEASVIVTVQGAGAVQGASSVSIESSSPAVVEGQTLDLNCLVPGQSHPSVTWHRRGGSLPARHQVSGSRLRLVQVSAGDSGEYVCSLRTGDTIQEASIFVTVARATDVSHPSSITPPIRIESSSSPVTEGQTLDLNCVVAQHSQAPVKWYKRGGSLPAKHQVFGSRLLIPRVTEADSGEYVCRSSTGTQVLEASVIVTIQAITSPSSPGITHPIRIESSSSHVTEGQTLDLNCAVDGQLSAQVTWYKRGGPLPAKHQISGSRLRLVQVTPADSGEYVCRVSTGSATKETSVLVTIQHSGVVSHPSSITPPVRIESSSSSVAEGQSLDLNCVVAGQSSAQVTWYKRGDSLPTRHQISGSRLRLVQVTPADSGEYVCRVSTGSATKETSVLVTIQHSGVVSHPSSVTPPVRIESSSSSVAEGQSLDLNCVVAGQSSAQVTWYKRGDSLPARHQVSGSRLRLVQVTPADSGEYVCRVSTGSATKETSVLVTIQHSGAVSHPTSITPPVRIESSSSSVAEGQSLDLNCVVAGQSSAQVTWYKRGDSLPARHQVSGSRLRLVQVTPADSGEYVCRVSTGSATKETSVLVTIQHSGAVPHSSGVTQPVVIESSSSSVAEGQTLELNCIVAGPSPAQVTWYKRGGSLPANHQVSGSRLRLPQVSAADSGEYVCRVVTSGIPHESSLIVTIEGSAGSYSVGVTPPARIETSSSSVIEGQTLDLNCMVAGHSHPRVSWHKRGGSLPASHQVLGSRLRLLQVSPADSGEYVCRVLNGAGSLEASVIVTVPSSAGSYYSSSTTHPIRIESSSSSLAEGQTLDLNCVVAGQPQITWHKRGGSLPDNHQVSGSHLRIPQVSSADSGEYVCRASAGGVTREAALIVTIEDDASPSRPSGFAPPVRVEASSSSVVEGQTVDLSCVVASQSQPHVTWYKRDGSLPAKHQVSGSRLRLAQVSVADSGEYVCRVSSGPASQEASITITVSSGDGSGYRLQSPIISIDPHSTTVRQGEDASFKCRIHNGARPINITWRMAPGLQLQDNVKISPNGSVITISQARASNQGTYHCVASNRFGIASSVVNLMVQESPTVSVMPEGPVTVKVGKSLSLECLGRGDPRPLVRWSRLGVRQKIEHQMLLPLESQAVLQISPVKPEDAGTYVCVAQNPVGSAQVQVEVTVQAAHRTPGAPEVTVEPTLTVVAGETATLHCSATGDPAPSIHWSKLRAPLPWQHKVMNNTLVIPRAAQQDSGQYICNASNAAGFSEAFVTLDVEMPPYATSLPDESSVRAGETVQLKCLAHGTPPLRYQWGKVNGLLSDRATLRDSILRISPAQAEDTGTYRCVVSNRVGSAETIARVSVQGGAAPPVSRGPPSVHVTPRVDTKGVGGTAEFTCTITGDPQAQIEWFKEDGELPASHSVTNGVLRIPNLDRSCQGVYTCRATSPSGEAQHSAKLVIQALPKVMINIRTLVQTVLMGSAVEFECLAIGDPKPHVTWSKVGGRLRPDIAVSGGTVKIERVEQSDAGQYRCTATNDVGTVQSHVILHVQSVPQIAAQPEMKEVAVGSTVVFPCLATGFPIPDIKWTKLQGDLPKGVRLESNILTIPSVKPEDAGVYICSASNRQGKVTAISMLKVQERVVPYFTQSPQSYLPLPTIKDAYKKFEIQITFRPDIADGMLLYNGQKKSTGADFVSFGLVGGRPEFRFDAGSGMATIRHPTPIRLGEFHTVRLYRNLTQGSLVLDDHPPVNGTSQGKFQGLDLNEELYLGGYPSYAAIAKTGLSSGFIGCVRQLLIQGEEVIFKDLDLPAHGVASCPTCKDQPCQNGGVCRDSESSSYVCHCPQGFTGSNCEHSQALHCHPEACGPDATCINRADGQGYTCRCHLGKTGEKCMEGVMVTTPFFNGRDAFISYPPLTNIHYELRVDAEFKPLSPDGLIFFSAGKGGPVEDFVSLAMAAGHLQFLYELGSGMAVLQSTEPLALGRWHRVSAERSSKDGTLVVDSGRPVKRSSPGKSQGLNLRTPMFLGGVDPSVVLPVAANVSAHFHGCVGEVSINGKRVDISYSFQESRSVAQCYDSSPCDRRPCLHGAKCLPTGEYEFQCLCQDGFHGDRCELADDPCLLGNPCLNGGTCKASRCLCPAGFVGTYCEQSLALQKLDREWLPEGSGGNDAPGQYGAYFYDGGYLALPRHLFPRSRPEAPETIELEVRTTSPNGVVLWQGVVAGEPAFDLHATNEEEGESGKAKDFISLGLKNGHLVFSYQLGSGEANIISDDPINDGEWHKVTAVREGRQGLLQVDGEEPVGGESPGNNIMVNTKGNVYIGGAPAVQTLTMGKFTSGITGCIKNLVLMNERPGQQPPQPIDLQHHVEAGTNTRECPS